MCGIMGYVGGEQAWPIVMSGLKRLEYRGYDSAGVATLSRKRIRLARAVGHIAALEHKHPTGLPGTIGIGHTRWATHGGVTEANCHPHLDPDGEVAVVHNGIIDNAEALRAELVAEGAEMASETDTELLSHLIARELKAGEVELMDAVRAALSRVDGTAGLLVMTRSQPERLVAARLGSPVVIGLGEDETWVASDQLALVPFTDRMVVLDDGEVAELTPGHFRTVDLQNRSREKRVERIEAAADEVELGDWPHFMLKEIVEQPRVVDRGTRGRLDAGMGTARLGGLSELGRWAHEIERVVLFGCGTSLNSALVGRYLLERYARIPTTAEDSAELSATNPIVNGKTLYVAVSQSGETADTLTALREVVSRGGTVAGITNVVGSTLARETACGTYIHAGPEISVCSTKAFVAQSLALTLLSLKFARMRHLAASDGREWVKGLEALPSQVEAMLAHKDAIRDLAETHKDARYCMFIGRGVQVPVAREGALKLKEIAYIPSDGLSGAEMKHGPLALVTQGTPVWALAPSDETRERMIGNLQELKARGATLLVVANPEDGEIRGLADALIPLPEHHPALSPMLTAVPLQLFAYYTACALGHDVDKPRNLAKSVTVL